jgi:aryl-alcohol dehydrogenase-like predicted oxidoreductase
MIIPNCKLPHSDKFKDFPLIPVLGVGTIWMGRRWPTNNEYYKQPTLEEINAHLDLAYESGIRMFDTAAAYGHSEEKLGGWLRNEKGRSDKLFIATKWGENFDIKTTTSITDHSLENLRLSFHRSLKCLSKIDLLYVHKANETVLSDTAIINEMNSYIKEGKTGYLGASVSDTITLEHVVNSNNLWFHFLQTSADVLLDRPDLIEKVYNAGVAIVINSPIRKSTTNKSPKECYSQIVQNPLASFVLTGTRTHLRETIDYFMV